MTFTVTSATGQRARIDPFDAAGDRLALLQLDWARSLDPVMAGWFARTGGPGTAMVRDASGGSGDLAPAVGVLDANELSGYPGVANVSIYIDTEHARGGIALEAYCLLVNDLFGQGARLIHHEVLEPNRAILRAMRALRVPSSARYREHAYAAGRWWDVLVFSYDEAHWRKLLDRMPNNPLNRPPASDEDPSSNP